jgi:hypothetical protein
LVSKFNIYNVVEKIVSNKLPGHWMGLRDHDGERLDIPLGIGRDNLEIPKGL